MRTYDIIVKKTGTERHSVDAASPMEAYDLYEKGDAHLKDDENDDVDSVTIVDRATGEEFDAGLFDGEQGEPEPETREYRVRLRATARVRNEDTITATSMEDALEQVSKIDLEKYRWGYRYSHDDGVDGDEIAYVVEVDDEEGDEIEVDLRAEGEPFSWTAVEIVKAMAAVDDADAAALAALVQRAKAACTKSVGDEG